MSQLMFSRILPSGMMYRCKEEMADRSQNLAVHQTSTNTKQTITIQIS